MHLGRSRRGFISAGGGGALEWEGAQFQLEGYSSKSARGALLTGAAAGLLEVIIYSHYYHASRDHIEIKWELMNHNMN